MTFLWILFCSVLVYAYYALVTEAEPEGAGAPAAPGPAAPDLPGVPVGVLAPESLERPIPAGGVDADPDYLDMDAFSRPRTDLPMVTLKATDERVYRGGAAGPHPNVCAAGMIDPFAAAYRRTDRRVGQRRKTVRREVDRTDHRAGEGAQAERRLAQRRVWLRRTEDQAGLDLVDIHEAAHMLSTTPAVIERWVQTADMPFYMVSKGAIREMQFDRIELLAWIGADDVIEARRRQLQKE